jgi:uncharacterized protein YfaT (DUF1175 family)
MKFLFLSLLLVFKLEATTIPSHELSALIHSKMLDVALAQSQKMSGHWDVSQRDCAGFIRYVYKKATGATGPLWVNQKKEEVSYLGAQELFSFNFDYLGHDLNHDPIQTGDLLVYNLPSGREQQWHLILLLKSPPGAPQKLLAMYHNGESGKKAQLKRVWAEDFLSKDLGPWSARKDNAHFVGIFRWKGWDSIKEKNNWKWFDNHKVSKQ